MAGQVNYLTKYYSKRGEVEDKAVCRQSLLRYGITDKADVNNGVHHTYLENRVEPEVGPRCRPADGRLNAETLPYR